MKGAIYGLSGCKACDRHAQYKLIDRTGLQLAHLDLSLPDPMSLVTIGSMTTSNGDLHLDRCYTLSKEALRGEVTFNNERLRLVVLGRCARHPAIDASFLQLLGRATWMNAPYMGHHRVIARDPGKYITIRLQYTWEELNEVYGGLSSLRHGMLHALSGLQKAGGQLTTAVSRFGRALTLPMFLNDLDTIARVTKSTPCFPDGPAEFTAAVEAEHHPVVAAVKQYVDSRNATVYMAAVKDFGHAAPSPDDIDTVVATASTWLSVQLKPYQIATVAWMRMRERLHAPFSQALSFVLPSGCVLLRERYSTWQIKWPPGPKQRSSIENSAHRPSGGVVMDEMGMGKTLETLTLLLCDLSRAKPAGTPAVTPAPTADATADTPQGKPKPLARGRRTAKRRRDEADADNDHHASSPSTPPPSTPVRTKRRTEPPPVQRPPPPKPLLLKHRWEDLGTSTQFIHWLFSASEATLLDSVSRTFAFESEDSGTEDAVPVVFDNNVLRNVPFETLFQVKYGGTRWRPIAVGSCEPTLVVVPLTLATQWYQEVALRVRDGSTALQPLVYHGSGRHAHADELHTHPLVITTYETVSADARTISSPQALYAAQTECSWQCPGTVCVLDMYKMPREAIMHGDIIVSEHKAGSYAHSTSEVQAMLVLTTSSRNVIPIVDPRTTSKGRLVSKGGVLTLPSDAWSRMRAVGRAVPCRAVHNTAAVTTCATCDTCIGERLQHYLTTKLLLSPLHAVHWHRVVLDESQKAADPGTAVFRDLLNLHASRRWCLSGTPMPRGFSSLTGQLQFLGLKLPYGMCVNGGLLKQLSPLFVRHTKAAFLPASEDGGGAAPAGMPADTLPPAVFKVLMVDMAPADAELYLRLHTRTVAAYTAAANADQVASSTKLLMQHIAHERHACSTTIPNNAADSDEGAAQDRPAAASSSGSGRAAAAMPAIPKDAINAEDECPICLDTIPYAAVLPCFHSFCHECLQTALEAGEDKCPLCQRPLSTAMVVAALGVCQRIRAGLAQRASSASTAAAVVPAPAPAAAPASAAGPVPAPTIHNHAKLDMLVHTLQTNPVPTVVFTQFDDALQALQTPLTAAGFKVHVLTGSLTLDARTRAIGAFNAQPSHVVLLLSLRAAAFGLNLTHGRRVVFMEPALSAALEAQAQARVHRLGQLHSIEVLHLITRGTVEERIHAFRTLDTSDADAGTSLHNGVRIVQSVEQHRAWRAAQLTNLIGVPKGADAP